VTHSTQLYAAICIKDFPVQALLRLRTDLWEAPCVVIEGEPPVQWICSLNEKARLHGATLRMTPVELDTFTGITILHRSPEEERLAKTILLDCAWSFSPRIEAASMDDTYMLVIDITGAEKLFGKPESLIASLKHSIALLYFRCSIAACGNYHASVFFARNLTDESSPAVIPPEAIAESLAYLPLTVVDLKKEHRELFRIWGIHTLGMLAALPELELIARMGQDGKHLLQLANGTREHHFQPVEPAFELIEHIELDTPVTLLDSLLFVIGVLLDQLICRATERILSLRAITITLTLNKRRSYSRTITPALPTNDRSLWLKLMHLDLESHPPNSVILAVHLSAAPGIPSPLQRGLFAPQSPEPARFDVTIARIRSIVGANNVGCVQLLDTHKPDAFRIETLNPSPEARKRVSHLPLGLARRQLRPPDRIDVSLTHNTPDRFFFQNSRYVVEHAYGPWLKSGDWWNPLQWSIEQWDVVAQSHDSSRLFCSLLHQREPNRWLMSALYD